MTRPSFDLVSARGMTRGHPHFIRRASGFRLREFAALATVVLLGTALVSCSSNSGQTESDAAKPSSGIELPAAIQKSGVIDVSSVMNYPPYSYLDERNGNAPKGILVELVDAVAAELGVDVEYHDIPFENVIPSIQSGRFDFNAGVMNDTVERQSIVSILDILNTSFGLEVQAGNPHGIKLDNLCGVVFATGPGSIQEQVLEEIGKECVAAGKPDVQQLLMSEGLVQSLMTGRVQAILSDPAVGKYYVSQNEGKIEMLQGLVPNVDGQASGWMFPKDSELLAPVVQAINNLIKDGTWSTLLEDAGLGESAILPPTVNLQTVEAG